MSVRVGVKSKGLLDPVASDVASASNWISWQKLDFGLR